MILCLKLDSYLVGHIRSTQFKRAENLANNPKIRLTCGDLEGGSGPPPTLEFAKLNIAEIAGNEKISYFSYLCTSTVIRQGWTPPGKIFWIRAWIKIKFSIYRMDHCPSESSYLTKETDVSNVISAPHTAQGQELLINHCSGYMYLPKFSYFIFY